eukprot:scaffold37648_cov194-Skeletonema_dohrnii-CCMP3373.AAC.1
MATKGTPPVLAILTRPDEVTRSSWKSCKIMRCSGRFWLEVRFCSVGGRVLASGARWHVLCVIDVGCHVTVHYRVLHVLCIGDQQTAMVYLPAKQYT